ncbi:MAG: SDR family oxidoreductase [Planctomycetota bacterium]|jgi:3-oxoacyl-[acyl-carrier protein] reductase|nr:SDR family oxidoreductase [Planctomycetota bacterium]
MSDDHFFKDKTAIVTGGGRGIGRAMAKRLAGLGALTILAGPTRENLLAVVADIQKSGGKAEAVPTDIGREEEVVSLFQFAAKRGGVDILVNNAAVGVFGRLTDTSAAEWDRVMGINLRGAFLCAREALKSMAAHGRGGRIINIASAVGFRGYVDQGLYTASKHGLVGLSKVMALEGREHGVITQVIAPGGVDTELLSRARPDLDRSGLMSPEDVADAMEYLLRQRGNALVDCLNLRRSGKEPW